MWSSNTIPNVNISKSSKDINPQFFNTFINNNSSDNKLSSNTVVKTKLQSWVLHYKVPHNRINCIQKIMRLELNVPTYVCTLMKTTKMYTIVSIGSDDGSYIHSRFEKMILPVLNKFKKYLYFTVRLKLGINVDGLPIFKSFKRQVWPILVSIINCEVLK